MSLFSSLPSRSAPGSTAIISACQRYRYTLTRTIGCADKVVTFIMLNPSTADAHEDDPTIRRCKGFARHFAAGKLIVVNLFAFRATKPNVLLAAKEPIGPENNDHIRRAAEEAHNSGGMVIAAWGAHGSHMDRDKQVMALLDAWDIFPKSLAETATGMPRHPLYLPNGCKPMEYGGRGA